MTAIINSLRALFTKNEPVSSNKPIAATTGNTNKNHADHKTQSVASEQFKLKALHFLQSLADVKERDRMKNAYNILRYIMNADSTKSKLNAHDLTIAIEYCITRAEKGNLSEEESREISDFFDKISSLPVEIFDRCALLGNKVALQKVLSPELAKLMNEQDQKPTLKDDVHHQLNIAIAKAKLSIRLGHGAEGAGGCNGAVKIKSLEGKYVGVFKPKPHLKWYQVSEHLKKYFGQARLLNHKDDMGQQFAEVAGFQFDEIMGFKLAPAATMAELKNQDGVFLAFLDGYKPLAKCEEELEKRNGFQSKEKVMWQKMCIYNFLVGNMDPHSENIFVKMQNSQLQEIRMIDHGNCFIEQNPGTGAPIGNQGHWGNYKISDARFEPEVLEFIRTHLTEDKLDAFVRSVGGRDKFWTIKMDQLQRARLDALRHGVLSGEIKSPRELSKLHTSKDIAKYAFKQERYVECKESTDVGDFAVLDIK